MIYFILRPIVRVALKIYFRKIHIVGLENIPKDQPIIFSSNHPSSFIEPCIMACFVPKVLHFLVRGDIFEKKWLKWLLLGTNQIPIYRRKDAENNIQKNEFAQNLMINLFRKNGSILIFPEASTIENLHLRSLRKGVVRFATMDSKINVHIVPIGITYQWGTPFNSEMTIKIGPALEADTFRNRNYKNDNTMHTSMIEQVSKAMKDCILDAKNHDQEPLMYDLLAIEENKNRTPLFPFVDQDSTRFTIQKSMIESLDNDDQFLEKSKEVIKSYKGVESQRPSFFDKIWMVLFMPVFIVAYVLHIIPYLFAYNIGFKKIKSHEFKASVFLAVLLLTNLLIFILSGFLAILIGWQIFVAGILYLSLGIFAVIYMKAFEDKWLYLVSSKEQKAKADALELEDFNHLVAMAYNQFNESI